MHLKTGAISIENTEYRNGPCPRVFSISLKLEFALKVRGRDAPHNWFVLVPLFWAYKKFCFDFRNLWTKSIYFGFIYKFLE
jgi:hypothetical protein